MGTISRVSLAGCAAVLMLASCASSTGSKMVSTPSEQSVSLRNIAFSPPSLDLSVGDEVTWINKDEAIVHTVTSGTPGTDEVPGATEGKPANKSGLFDSGELQTGDTFTFTFDKEGTYKYFCEVHPSMTAEISVVP